MKANVILVALTVAAMLMSCNKENSVPEDNGNNRVEVRFTSGIGGIVKAAADTIWSANDAIGVYMKEAGQPLSSTTILEGVDNLQYTASASGSGSIAFTATGSPAFYPPSANVDFIAYYPYVASLTSYTYPVDVSQQTSQPAIDLMYANNATNLNKLTSQVQLNFDHQLAKLVFNITAGDGVVDAELSGLTVTISGMNTTASFSVVDGTLSNLGTVADISVQMSSDRKKGEAIILPASVTGGTIRFALNNADGDVFTWNIPAATQYTKGHKMTYTVVLSRTGMAVTGNITPWVNDSNTIIVN